MMTLQQERWKKYMECDSSEEDCDGEFLKHDGRKLKKVQVDPSLMKEDLFKDAKQLKTSALKSINVTP